MFRSKFKLKALVLLCIFVCFNLPTTITSASSAKVSKQRKNYQKIVSIVVQECKKYRNVPPEIILAIISKESSFNPLAKSKAVHGTQCIGAMQLNPKTARTLWKHFYPKVKFQTSKLLIPEINIKLGIWHFNNVLAKYNNNLQMALTVYNRGAGGYKKYLASRGTYISSYSKSVMRLSKVYKVKK